MPCTICFLTGHNRRTCLKPISISEPLPESELGSAQNVKKNTTLSSNNSHYCYIMQRVDKSNIHNYVGYTVNLERRIRQHNGLIGGRAKFTKNKSWEYLMIFSCPMWNSTRGFQLECLINHSLKKKRRSVLYKGSLGNIHSLHEIIKRIPSNEIISIYVHDDYYQLVDSMSFTNNVHILPMTSLPVTNE